MTRFYTFSPEKKDKSKAEIYIKMILFGLLAGVVFIGGLNVVSWIIKTAIKYYIWILVVFGILFFGKKFFNRKKRVKIVK